MQNYEKEREYIKGSKNKYWDNIFKHINTFRGFGL